MKKTGNSLDPRYSGDPPTLLPMFGQDATLVEYVKDLRPLTALVLQPETKAAIDRVLAEHYRSEEILNRGLRPANRLLFHGPPGCGKTVSAGAIALALGIPLASLRLDGVISSYLGESAAKLRRVFDMVKTQRCVLLIDEVDALGRSRSDMTHDVGEMKRVVNSLLVMLEEIQGPSLVIAATNHEGDLDPALWRRFDEVVEFPRPTSLQALALLNLALRQHNMEMNNTASLGKRLAGMSFADVERVAVFAMKSSVLHDSQVADEILTAIGRERARHPKQGKRSR